MARRRFSHLGLLLEAHDAALGVRLHNSELMTQRPLDLDHRHRRLGLVGAVESHHFRVIHLVDVVACHNQHLGDVAFDHAQVLEHGVGGAVKQVALPAERRMDGKHMFAQLGPVDIPRQKQMAVERRGFRLHQYADFADAGVDAVG